MGVMTFQLPAGLAPDAARELERACVAGGGDNMPWPTEAAPVTTSIVPISFFSHSSRSLATRPAAFGRAPQGTQYSMRTWCVPAMARS